MSKQFLTEKLLLVFLEKHYNNEIIYNKSVPNSNLRTRPDFRLEENKLIIEFDGYHHYNSSKRIIKDIEKDKCYKSMGYKVIRIPYYLQLNKEIIKQFFKLDVKDNFNNYPCGFWDFKSLLPADFCSLGLVRFTNELSYLKNYCPNSFKEIMLSLKLKSKNSSLLETIPKDFIFRETMNE